MIACTSRRHLFIPIDQALADAKLLGAALGDTQTWQTWRVVLKAAFGLELNREQARAFASVAGSRQRPAERVRELWCIVGRRGGKSKMAAAIAVYLAVFVQHRLSAGERGLVLCLAASTEQAGYAKAFLTESPVLRQAIDEITRSRSRVLQHGGERPTFEASPPDAARTPRQDSSETDDQQVSLAASLI